MSPPEIERDDQRSLGVAGEGAALAALLPLLPSAGLATLGPGDDSAVLSVPDGRVVISCDMMIEGPDFRRDWSSLGDVGFKAIAMTVLGNLQGLAPVTRAGARPGNVLALAGERGLSHRGLTLLRAAPDAAALHALREEDASVVHHLRPVPPVPLGPVAAQAGATAMMDVSDGLVLDATRMARASGVQMELDSALEWDESSLFGGEDHGLLACFPAGVDLPAEFIAIGVVQGPSAKASVVLAGYDLQSSLGGWDPFGDHVAE